MDFLKEIVKEIGDEYTQIAADIDETERFIDTGSHIFVIVKVMIPTPDQFFITMPTIHSAISSNLNKDINSILLLSHTL